MQRLISNDDSMFPLPLPAYSTPSNCNHLLWNQVSHALTINTCYITKKLNETKKNYLTLELEVNEEIKNVSDEFLSMFDNSSGLVLVSICSIEWDVWKNWKVGELVVWLLPVCSWSILNLKTSLGASQIFQSYQSQKI